MRRAESVGVYVGRGGENVYTLLGLSVQVVNAWRGAVEYLFVKG